MSILCLWSPDWRTGEGPPAEVVPLLLEEAPRVVVEGRGLIWVDVRGLPAGSIAARILERLEREEGEGGGEIRGGVASKPIVAVGAAIYGGEPLTIPGADEEAGFLASLPLELVTGDERLLTLLDGAGLRCCGDLGNLTAEAVEVRFGVEGVRAWRLARGDDPRVLFSPIPAETPTASVDFVDYTVRDATRLVFTLNALLDQVCSALRARARRARAIELTFSLADGTTVQEVLRTARPTSDRTLWIRRLRGALDEIRLSQPISGVSVAVGSSDPVSGLQGDLFDRGFSTASFVEEAVTRLLDTYRGLFVRQISVPDPLAERRARWVDLTPDEVAGSGPSRSGSASSRAGIPDRGRERPRSGSSGKRGKSGKSGSSEPVDAPPPALSLQLLSEPRPIRIRGRSRRDHVVPVRFLEDGAWRDLTSAGPDRISGGHEEAQPYAREYYRCVSETGALLWIYRDAVDDRWFLHGWWG